MAFQQFDADFVRAMRPHIHLYDKLEYAFSHGSPALAKLVLPYLDTQKSLMGARLTYDAEYLEQVMLRFPNIDTNLFREEYEQTIYSLHLPTAAVFMRNNMLPIDPLFVDLFVDYLVDYRWKVPANRWIFPPQFEDLPSLVERFIGDGGYMTFADIKVELFLIVRKKAWAFDSYGVLALKGRGVIPTSARSLGFMDELLIALQDRRLATTIPDRVAVKCRTFSCRVALDILSNEYDDRIRKRVDVGDEPTL
ncbi:hypothetical protein SARC_07281 [Sphaeroforma arctica JP610]|uniref:Uncharacterized protein n=1 Tax=Sphaeroforma arctica JP610 TaxID=667725 RepID=A0A0L0FWN2_9EUKA|nr:hypothetical protein SARC_07281 [Sphaeroforma arctica JP610]KNC80363.1 hypothetical protein SARC_07281 [Sphaeroforma arctica JP610]|eukprot:XP_014154265.1 hypothetical protein SARC_07281 [Sphaeroforma arctica JP610]